MAKADLAPRADLPLVLEEENRMTQPAERPPSVPGAGGTVREGAQRELAFAYAGRWRRLIAGLIDFAVVYVITLIIDIPLLGYQRTIHGGKGSIGHQILTDLIAIVIGLIYYAAPHARWGQTLGKRLMGIRVVQANDAGAISYGKSAWRFISLIVFEIIADLLGDISGPLVFLGLVNIAWILWDPHRQALHDKLARTTVVNQPA